MYIVCTQNIHNIYTAVETILRCQVQSVRKESAFPKYHEFAWPRVGAIAGILSRARHEGSTAFSEFGIKRYIAALAAIRRIGEDNEHNQCVASGAHWLLIESVDMATISVPPNPSLLSERLDWAIAHKETRDNVRLTYADLTRAAGMSKGASTGWKDNRGMSARTAAKLAKILQVDARWIETGEGNPVRGEVPADKATPGEAPPIQAALAAIVKSLIHAGKLSDKQCLDLIAHLNTLVPDL